MVSSSSFSLIESKNESKIIKKPYFAANFPKPPPGRRDSIQARGRNPGSEGFREASAPRTRRLPSKIYVELLAHVYRVVTVVRVPDEPDQVEGDPVFREPLDFEGVPRVFRIAVGVHQGGKGRDALHVSNV